MKTIAALSLLFLLVGCSAYVPNYYYLPHPGLIGVATTQPSQQTLAQVLVTVVGIRYEDSKLNLPLSVEVRVNVDNKGTSPISVDPGAMQLNSGDLSAFSAPLSTPQSPLQIAPGQSGVLTAEFPFPDNGATFYRFDLSSLQLRLTLQVNGQLVQLAQTFRRSYYQDYAYDPYWEPYPYSYPYYGPYVGGVVVVRHRW